jgi:hypothetical protein
MIVSSFIVQASFTIVSYDRQNMFIIQATEWYDKQIGETAIIEKGEMLKAFSS